MEFSVYKKCPKKEYLCGVSPSQVPVDIVMWQKDFGKLLKVFRLMLLQPQNLGGCETRDQVVIPLFRQRCCLLGTLHITPKLGIPNDLSMKQFQLHTGRRCP